MAASVKLVASGIAFKKFCSRVTSVEFEGEVCTCQVNPNWPPIPLLSTDISSWLALQYSTEVLFAPNNWFNEVIQDGFLIVYQRLPWMVKSGNDTGSEQFGGRLPLVVENVTWLLNPP